MSRDPNLSNVNLASKRTTMPSTPCFFGETCQNFHQQTSDSGNDNKTNDKENYGHNKNESEMIESSEMDLIYTQTDNDNLTPSIILTSDDTDWKPCEQGSISSMESISNSPSPRTSYNSLLHWGINNAQDERGKYDSNQLYDIYENSSILERIV